MFFLYPHLQKEEVENAEDTLKFLDQVISRTERMLDVATDGDTATILFNLREISRMKKAELMTLMN